ncbi:MAG TPA: FAD-dependent oxidoreductase, partial [Ignavibacteriales bacterium]|nr:FAD-dependent oxidoreductase [Ignavibacteriales bacterium]
MYDVIIIGLGPAGSTAAYYLAQKGHNVLGLEKLKMPRHKPCAGCISSRIKKIFDEDITTLS